MSFYTFLICIAYISFARITPADSLAFGEIRHPKHRQLRQQAQQSLEASNNLSNHSQQSRRQIMSSIFFLSIILPTTYTPANARYIRNEDGEFVDVPEENWQTVWKQRLDKANTMSTAEIFEAGRGAGNVDLKVGEESDASKKRRAMSACRDGEVRAKADVDTKTCNSRVMAGEIDFILKK